ncbi:MAG: NAD-dependent epimerase/dehydratase family protein, partial [Cetobacterium sp.]
MKKTLMITGASGFIGSNFIKRYAEDYNIIPVDLLKVKPEELDYTDVDTILHLAALVHQMKGAPEEKYYEVNTELTRRVAECAKKGGVKHFVFYSTVKVYGFDGELKNHKFVLTENSPCHPNDPYGGSKYEAEKLLRAMSDENFKVAMVRPPMVYGEGVKGNMLSL